jgi:hypothetical protein
MILKKDKNSLLTIIQEFSLDPILFYASDGNIEEKAYFIIELRNSPICFAFRPSVNTFDEFFYRHSLFSPDFPLTMARHLPDIESLRNAFKSWLGGVVQPYLDDTTTPDLWQLMENTRSDTILDAESLDYSKSFSEDEKTRIRLSIDEFRLLIVNTFDPHKKELDAINNRLKYLSDAMDKHNKFDWKGIAISTVISIAVTLSLNPDQFNQLVQLFKNVFSTVIYLLP